MECLVGPTCDILLGWTWVEIPTMTHRYHVAGFLAGTLFRHETPRGLRNVGVVRPQIGRMGNPRGTSSKTAASDMFVFFRLTGYSFRI